MEVTQKEIMEEVKTSTAALTAEVKRGQEEQAGRDKQIKEETAEAQLKSEARIEQLNADLEGAQEKHAEELKEIKSAAEKKDEALDSLKATIDEWQLKGQRPGAQWAGEEVKTPADLFLCSEQFKEARSCGRIKDPDFKIAVQMKSLWPAREEKADFLSTAATRLVMPQRINLVDPALRALRIRDLLNVFPTSSNAIEYVREIEFIVDGAGAGQTHGAAAETAEGAPLPEAELKLELLTENVRDIGHHLPASRQILNDDAQMRNYIDTRLAYGVSFKEDRQLLYGTGVSPQILGILANTGTQDLLWSGTPTGTTKLDVIRKAITLAQKAEYVPSGIVINPADWEDVVLLKGTDKHYILLAVPAEGAVERLFRIPVVVTNAIDATDILVGAFSMGAAIYDREEVNIRVSEHHDLNFINRMVTILAEERIAFVNTRPDAFVHIDATAAPA